MSAFNKLLFTLIFTLSVGLIYGQNDFGRMTGKSKSKAAKKEEKEAKKDDVYQKLMEEGHTFFQEKNYQEALDKYKTAATRRPINVYPKVKIADVELAMLNHKDEEPMADASKEIELPTEEPEVIEPEVKEPTQEERVAEALAAEEQKIKDALPPPPKIEEPKKEIPEEEEIVEETPKVTAENIEVISEEDFAENLAETYPDGVTEEIFEEGGKKITRRVVVKNGKGTDYRMVVHRWGGKFFFKNNESITEHTWNTETVLD